MAETKYKPIDIRIVVDGQIAVKKAGSKYDLAELVARIPKQHRAEEVGFGLPVGKEEW